MTHARDVAEWMAAQLESNEYLSDRDAADRIKAQFGEEFIYLSDAGKLAIAPPVLNEFRKLTEHTVIWDEAGQHWRKRTAGDHGW